LGIFEQWVERKSREGRQYFGINLIYVNSCAAIVSTVTDKPSLTAEHKCPPP
jgi:hypothetical protein